MRRDIYDDIYFYKYAQQEEDLNVDVDVLKQELKDKIINTAKKSLKYGTIGLGVGYGLGVAKGINGVRRGRNLEIKNFINDARAEGIKNLSDKRLREIFLNAKNNAKNIPGLENLGDKTLANKEIYKELMARHAAKEGIKGLIPGMGLGIGMGDWYENSKDDIRKARIILNSERKKK